MRPSQQLLMCLRAFERRYAQATCGHGKVDITTPGQDELSAVGVEGEVRYLQRVVTTVAVRCDVALREWLDPALVRAEQLHNHARLARAIVGPKDPTEAMKQVDLWRWYFYKTKMTPARREAISSHHREWAADKVALLARARIDGLMELRMKLVDAHDVILDTIIRRGIRCLTGAATPRAVAARRGPRPTRRLVTPAFGEDDDL